MNAIKPAAGSDAARRLDEIIRLYRLCLDETRAIAAGPLPIGEARLNELLAGREKRMSRANGLQKGLDWDRMRSIASASPAADPERLAPRLTVIEELIAALIKADGQLSAHIRSEMGDLGGRLARLSKTGIVFKSYGRRRPSTPNLIDRHG